MRGIIFIDYLEKGNTINSEYYITLLERLKAEIANKQWQWQWSIKTMAKLHELNFELLPHPPHCPDLAPSDYWLFSDLKKMLAGKKFRSNEEVIAETEACFEVKDKSFYRSGIEMLERRWNDCVALNVDYIDE